MMPLDASFLILSLRLYPCAVLVVAESRENLTGGMAPHLPAD